MSTYKNIILNFLKIWEKEGRKTNRKYKLWVTVGDFNNPNNSYHPFIGYAVDRRLRELCSEGKLQRRWSDRETKQGRKLKEYALI